MEEKTYELRRDNVVKFASTERKRDQLLALGYTLVEEEAEKKKSADNK
ncbi:hypothetical protein KQR54_18780 [Mycobacterium gordonae]|nr:hypothetical protein [Mycobacterium gordonae]